jgi:hypothetical protein
MKNIHRIYLVLVLCLYGLFSCNAPLAKKKFFDVPGYFKGEISFIQNNFTTVLKSSVYNGDSAYQQLKVSEVNWNKELAIFLESDINKPAYYANMQADDQGSCRATSNKLSIQEVLLGYGAHEEQNRVVNVQIVISKTNLISSTNIRAEYQHGYAYTIRGDQKIKNLGDHNDFYIQGLFKK